MTQGITAYQAIKKQDAKKTAALLSLVRDSKGNPITKDWVIERAVASVERSERSLDETALMRGLKLICDVEGFIKERASGKAAEYNRYTAIIQNIMLQPGQNDAPSAEQLQAAKQFSRQLPDTVEADYEEVEDGLEAGS